MKKKVLSFMLATSLIVTQLAGVSVYANENASINETQYKVDGFFEEGEAAEIALLFIYENINNQDEWTMETKIKEVYNLYDLDENLTAYTFTLETDGKDSGYITVSGELNQMPIQEFSFIDKPIFEETGLSRMQKNMPNTKLIYNGPLNYFYSSGEKIYSNETGELEEIDSEDLHASTRKLNNDTIVDNTDLEMLINESIANKQTRANYDGQYDGYVISSTTLYLADRYGNYTYKGGKILPNFPGLLQSNFGGKSDNDCTLVSLTAIAKYYNTKGYTKIPSDTSTIYSDILTIAKGYGYTGDSGTFPTKINNIVEDSFSKWGYKPSVSSLYMWSYNTHKNQIDSGNPNIVNTVRGAYANHSVSMVGYNEYDKANFISVKDNWTTSTRSIDFAEYSANSLGSVTKITF